jgi:selenocysteine lyase/cysteine desulfurase
VLRGIGITHGWNVYVSPFEHNAVMRVLHFIRKSVHVNVRTLAVKSTGYDLTEIREQFSENKPHLVVISHASNVCGLVAPIKEIFVRSKEYGAINVVDMAQTMGLIDTHLSSEIYDYAVFAGHKTLYGPLGVGGIICSADARPEPLLYGGTGIDSSNPDLPETLPERYEIGSLNIQAVAGLNAALKWIQVTGIENIRNQEVNNRRMLLALFAHFPNIQVVGASLARQQENLQDLIVSENVGVISCVFEGYASNEAGQAFNERNIAVRTGLHCAPSAHRFLGTFPAGTVRFSPSYFTTDNDFNILKVELEYIEQHS